MSEGWTPYGLEALRARILWRRRIRAVLAAVLVTVLLLLLLSLMTKKEVVETRISLSGGEGGDTIEVETPGDLRTKPLRVALSPGGTTIVGNGLDGATNPDQLSRASTNYPYIRGERPINWLALMFPWGFLAIVGYLVWASGRGTSVPSSEVNFGIYKGAMPLEMITASYRHLVRTQRLAQEPIFGKEREDYVPPGTAPSTAPVAFTPVRR